MKKALSKYLLIGIIGLCSFSCKKDQICQSYNNNYCQNASYQTYSSSSFDFEKKHLVSQYWGGTSYEYIDTFVFGAPVFCQLNYIPFNQDMALLMEVIESNLARELQPILGRH